MNSIFIVIPILTLLMFDLGLTLRVSDFTEIRRNPKAVVVGLIGQLVVLPAVAFAVAGLFQLPEVFYVGLVLIACCPGGSSSNIFSKLAGGDVSLSVTLTAFSSVLTLLTIPVVLELAMDGSEIALPVGKLFMQNIVMMLLPIVAGMAVRRYSAKVAAAIESVLGRLAFPALILLASIFFVENRECITENIGVLGASVATLLIVAIACGAALCYLFRLKENRRRTIVIEVGMQNAAQAIAIASSPFVLANSEYAVPAIIYALLMNVVLLTYVGLIRAFARKPELSV